MSFHKEAKACRVLANELTGRYESEVLLRMAKAYEDLSRNNYAEAGSCRVRALQPTGTDS